MRLKLKNGELSNFTDAEWVCHCGNCNQMIIDQDLLEKMQQFRNRIEKPCPVHCVNRCEDHNNYLIKIGVKASKTSQHLNGSGCDFHVRGIRIRKLHAIVLASDDIFDGGIGLYDWGVHVDTGRKRIWDNRQDTK